VSQQRLEPAVLEEVTVGSARAAGEAPGGSPGSGSRYLWSVMKEVGLVQSSSEARRLIEQGAVMVDQVRVATVDHVLAPGAHIIQVGKRRFLRVVLDEAGTGAR